MYSVFYLINIHETINPTVDKPNIRILILIATSYGWKLGSSDVKSAFLQGQQLDRRVVLVPPKEANVEKGKLWELQVALYGIAEEAVCTAGGVW